MIDQIGVIHERLQDHDITLRDLKRRVEAVMVGDSVRADAIDGIIPAANAPVNWFYNGNLLGAGTRADWIAGAGVWISGTFVAGRAYYLIGAYATGGGGTSGTVAWYVEHDHFCDALEAELAAGAGIWISGTCEAGGTHAKFEIGAYASPGGAGDDILALTYAVAF